jgi:hypothetical protein
MCGILLEEGIWFPSNVNIECRMDVNIIYHTFKSRTRLLYLFLKQISGMLGGIWSEGTACLPGHNVVQAIFCMLCPSQKAPPLSGAGLVQVRVRFWYPRPQRLLHTDHSVQVDQPPFTERRQIRNSGLNMCVCTHGHTIHRQQTNQKLPPKWPQKQNKNLKSQSCKRTWTLFSKFCCTTEEFKHRGYIKLSRFTLSEK